MPKCRTCEQKQKTYWKKFTSIVQGWKNLVFKSERMERLAKTRAQICSACEHLTELGLCGRCKCYIEAKIRSYEEECPIDKW